MLAEAEKEVKTSLQVLRGWRRRNPNQEGGVEVTQERMTEEEKRRVTDVLALPRYKQDIRIDNPASWSV